MGGTGVIDNFLGVFTSYIDSGFGLLGGEVAFIRVNPELPCADRPDLPSKPRIRFIPVMAKGLAALELIDAAINKAARS